MRKMITLLMVVFLACSVAFAVENTFANIFRLRSSVSSISISRANSMTPNGLFTAVVGTSADNDFGADITSNSDISMEDVKAYFKITQNGLTKTNESIKINILAEPMAMMDEDGEIWQSKMPSMADFIGLENEAVVVTSDIYGNEIDIYINYMGGHTEVTEGTVLATFISVWPKSDDLFYHGGEYISNIILRYDVV